VLKTGFGAIIHKVHDFPMPEYAGFETDTIEKVKAFHFDDPWDDRRFYKSGDSHIHCIGDDKIGRNAPSFTDELKRLVPDFAVFGSVIEASEFMVRSIGQTNMMLWMGLYPDEIGKFAERINAYILELAKAQIKIAGGLLDGFFIAGDVAYAKNMFFSPDYWRKYFKPGVKAIIDLAHENGLPVLYHGCGNVSAILDDFVEIKLDAYHPLETKAGLDVVELRRKMGHKLCFIGNNDVQLWAEGDMRKIEAYTLKKLNAAKGGGYFFGADHSVPSDVSGIVYDQIVKLVRKHGNYPLQLGTFDIKD
jgi:uroporphyrinogen-III decarboxylase